jgi:hypothetical protein
MLISNTIIGAYSRIDIAGVASSILATPTIKNPAALMGWRGFSMPFIYGKNPSTHPIWHINTRNPKTMKWFHPDR